MRRPDKPPFSFSDFFTESVNSTDAHKKIAELIPQLISASSTPTHNGKYIHWDELRRLKLPHELSHELLWASLKLHRIGMMKEVPLQDSHGKPFRFALPDPAPGILRFVDMEAGGSIRSNGVMPDRYKRDQYVVQSLIEEATTSSQIEGASTTRRVAKEMIQSGRPPRDRGERMIMNNYLTMQHVRTLKSIPLSPKVIFDLHSRIADGTIDDDELGRFRREDESVAVVENSSGDILYVPPPAKQLPGRMEALCAFANGDTPSYFLHPVVRSVILHFWLSFDHPFTDGNGRCARTLFYWSMLRHGYWLVEYISISRLIRTAQAQYSRAFLLTETDDNDLAYFILYHLDLLKRAIDDVHGFVERKTQERIRLEVRLERMRDLNHRQRALIAHALRNPGFEYTTNSHGRRQQISAQTARTDLYDLVKRRLLRKKKIGKTWHFHAVADLESMLEKKT